MRKRSPHRIASIVSYPMSSVDQKWHQSPLFRLASLSVFWCIVFILFFKTNYRYTFGDKIAVLICGLAYGSLALYSWKAAHCQIRRAFTLFLYALVPLLPILFSMLPFEEPALLPWLVLDFWFLSMGTVLLLRLPLLKPTAETKLTPVHNNSYLQKTIVALAITFFFFTGAIGIGKQALIDEALWTHERIPRFFENISQGEFANTRVSDKPGVTIMLASGATLLGFSPDPMQGHQYDSKAEVMSTSFRLPILLTATLLLFFIFIFVSRATSPSVGALTILFIGTSPVLIGISRIINPDALLWGFFSLSFFAYFAFLSTRQRKNLLWSGFFFGMALLTKYVSNFLIIFLVALTPLLMSTVPSTLTIRQNLLERLQAIIIVFLIGIGTLFILYPATWTRPDRLLKATFFSEAFIAIALPFLIFIVLSFADAFWWRHTLLRTLIATITRYKTSLFRGIGVVFLLCITLVLSSVWLGSPFIDFPTLLSSPKSSFGFESVNPLTFFLANFYPFLFNQTPIVLLGVILSAVALYRHADRTAFALPLVSGLLFIFSYYIGATASQVLSISRYQISVFPIACFIAALGVQTIITPLTLKYPRKHNLIFIVSALFIGSFSVSATLFVSPHYSSYSSPLLPHRFITEYSDMGDGLYEAADYLNNLPNATSLTIYTDRAPICRFFVGHCLTGFANTKLLKKTIEEPYDYIVVHSNNQSRTSRFITPSISNPRIIRFDRAYDFDQPEKTILINGRPGQNIKIIRANQLSLINDGRE